MIISQVSYRTNGPLVPLILQSFEFCLCRNVYGVVFDVSCEFCPNPLF